MNDSNLRVPGPTPVPEPVARAGARPMVNHRGPEFAEVMHEVAANLKPFFGTQQLPLLLTGSGTAALEAAVVNMLSPGDHVLSAAAGVFGDRFSAIAEAFGADVRYLRAEWGSAVTAEALEAALWQGAPPRAVLLTHNETSTGVTHDIAALAAAARRAAPRALILVDGVSSIGALPFAMDEWDVDVALTGSQKAWMSPPGLAIAAVSERGWEAQRSARMPRYYWDFMKARTNAEKGTAPFTPAVGIVHALQEALHMMTAEGPENVYTRHACLGRRMREGIAALGLELFAEPRVASNTVTAVRVPSGIEASDLIGGLKRHGVVVAGGQDRLKGEIFRIGHMGWVHEEDIEGLLAALRVTLEHLRVEEAV